MRKFNLLAATVVLAATAFVLGGLVTAQEQGGRPLKTTLSGAAEVPGPGDTDGSGKATITVNEGQVCFELSVSNIAPATAAHIHKAPADQAGPVVVTLTAPTDGSSKDCVSADAALIKDIWQNPGDYYINVHTQDFPAGAVRGQLAK